MEAVITKETLNKWANSKEAQRDNIAVQIGQYMQQYSVSRSQAIKVLGVEDPAVMEIK